MSQLIHFPSDFITLIPPNILYNTPLHPPLYCLDSIIGSKNSHFPFTISPFISPFPNKFRMNVVYDNRSTVCCSYGFPKIDYCSKIWPSHGVIITRQFLIILFLIQLQAKHIEYYFWKLNQCPTLKKSQVAISLKNNYISCFLKRKITHSINIQVILFMGNLLNQTQ